MYCYGITLVVQCFKGDDFMFKMGMAKEDVTPELNCLLYGYPRERRAQRVMDPLSVGAVVVTNGEETLLFFGVDICSMNMDVCDKIRERIGEQLGIDKKNIMYSCIHTHSAPVTRNSPGWGVADWDYIDGTLIPKSVEAAKKAMATMQEATLGVGVIESQVGINRRQIENGEVILGQKIDGPYDPHMTMLTFKSLEGKVIGSVIHYACHPTVAGSNFSITRDWPSYMIDRIEEVSGAPCMYINGAEGDVGPRLSNGRTTADESYIPEIGIKAADDAEKAYRSITDFKVPELKVHAETIKFPYVEIPSLEEVEREIEAMGDPEKLVATEISKHTQYCKIRDIHLSGAELPDHLDVEQTVIALGELAMVPFAFEAFSTHALNLRKNSPFKDTILLGLTGGSYGYLPTLDQIELGGYEIQSFHAASIPQFDDDLGRIIVEQNVELLKKLYNK